MVEEAHLRLGHPAEEILRLSEEIIAGLIVVGNQGLSGRFSRMKRFVMGSVSENVARYARCQRPESVASSHIGSPRVLRNVAPARQR
jgi:hypothetical protein